jgi:hypothetical protein
MKNTLMILGILLGAIIVITLIALFISSFQLPANRSTSSDSDSPIETIQNTSMSPSPVVSSPSVNSQQIEDGSLTDNPISLNANVDFNLYITAIAESGLTSREVTAQITNTGNTDAHNTWVHIEAFSQGNKCKINGKYSILEDFGTIKSGETLTRQVNILFSVFDATGIMQNGVSFHLTINSDEKSQLMTYDYTP